MTYRTQGELRSAQLRYRDVVRRTDRLKGAELTPVLLGIAGELGSITTIAKKLHREDRAYVGFISDAEEEFGDALWYMTALGQRIGVDVVAICSALWAKYISHPRRAKPAAARDESLLALACSGGDLLRERANPDALRINLASLISAYIGALAATGLDLATVIERNIQKTTGRFLDPAPGAIPELNGGPDPDERLPQRFAVNIRERKDGRVWMQLNEVFIGGALTDNIADKDGYRFHDVFHFAYAAHLHWSPVTRALLKRKRKSNPLADENEDGGRAIVIEEGISALVFARAKQLHYFSGHSTVTYDLLKAIQEFVKGYEVQKCLPRQWERAILEGYAVFRCLKEQRKGTVIVDLRRREISFLPLRNS